MCVCVSCFFAEGIAITYFLLKKEREIKMKNKKKATHYSEK